jgi:sulfatase modifying factor 1
MSIKHVGSVGIPLVSSLLAACGTLRGGCPEEGVLAGNRCAVEVAAAPSDASAAAPSDASAAAPSDASAAAPSDASAAAPSDASDLPMCGAGSTLCGRACVNIQSDVSNCGACGVRCEAGHTCLSGACTSAQRSCQTASTPGCGMVRVMGGTFMQGEAAAHRADVTTMSTVSPFAIDAYEVTVARFRLFWEARAESATLAAIRLRPIAYRGGTISWGAALDPVRRDPVNAPDCNWSETEPQVMAHPMNCINYWLAQEFCVWDGGRLPTEAEWEFAARGRAAGGLVPGRVYPWGDEDPQGSRELRCDRAQINGCIGDDRLRTRRVGSFEPTAGIYDLAGNVSEWTADSESLYYSCRVSSIDPICINRLTQRITRGGDWTRFEPAAGRIFLRAASRSFTYEMITAESRGFRCARDLR